MTAVSQDHHVAPLQGSLPILVAVNATFGVIFSPVVLLPATSIPISQFKPHHLSHGSLQLLLAVLLAPLSCSPPVTSCTKPRLSLLLKTTDLLKTQVRLSVATPNPTLVPPSQSKIQSPYGNPRCITFPSATSLDTRTHARAHAHLPLLLPQSRTLSPPLSLWDRSPSCHSGSVEKARCHGGLPCPLLGHSSARTSQISTIFCLFFFSKHIWLPGTGCLFVCRIV